MTRRFTLAVAAVVLLFVGCITGAAISNLVVPKVRAGTDPQRWEYMCFHELVADAATEKANRAGHEGWEMSGLGASPHGGIFCFKRPLP